MNFAPSKEQTMTTLILHPKDQSTDFLSAVYNDKDPTKDLFTLVTKPVSRSLLHQVMSVHDRIVIMGHGTQDGLLRVPFDTMGSMLIDSRNVQLLRQKECWLIWCYASDFALKYKIPSFATGMFISEADEALSLRVPFTSTSIDESNAQFALTLKESLWQNRQRGSFQEETLVEMYEGYCPHTAVGQYNRERLAVVDTFGKRITYENLPKEYKSQLNVEQSTQLGISQQVSQ